MSQSKATARAAIRGWRVVALLMLVVGLGHFNRISITVAGTEQIIKSGLLDPEQMGRVYTAFLLCYTLAMIPGGWAIDRFGPRVALLVLLVGSTVFVSLTGATGLVLGGTSRLWIGLLAVRALMGMVNAPLHPASARMVYASVPAPTRSLANGFVTFAACVGVASTYYGFGKLIDAVGWPLAFQITSGITLVAAVIWTIGTSSLKPAAAVRDVPAPVSAPPGGRPRYGRVLRLTVSYAALGYFQYLFFYWIQYYFDTVRKVGVDESRLYSTLITLTMGVGMVLGGWLADRLGSAGGLGRRSFVPGLGMLASGLVFELGLLGSDPRVTLATFASSAFLIGMCEGAFWTTVVELGGARGGLAAALMNTGGNFGGALSPSATPMLSNLFAQSFGNEIGWRLSLAVAGLVSIVGASLWLRLDAPRRDEPF